MTGKIKKNEGFGLLEIAISVGVISLSLFSLASVSNLALNLAEESVRNTQAAFLMEEGAEAIKILRDSGWSANISPLVSGADYYLDFSGNSWRATSTNIYVDGIFERKFSLQNVSRDSGDRIVSSGGAPDPGTKKLAVYVAWRSRLATTTQTISAYITNLFNN